MFTKSEISYRRAADFKMVIALHRGISAIYDSETFLPKKFCDSQNWLKSSTSLSAYRDQTGIGNRQGMGIPGWVTDLTCRRDSIGQ